MGSDGSHAASAGFRLRVDEDGYEEIAREGLGLQRLRRSARGQRAKEKERERTCSRRESLPVPAELETIRTLLAPKVLSSSSHAGCSEASNSSDRGLVCPLAGCHQPGVQQQANE